MVNLHGSDHKKQVRYSRSVITTLLNVVQVTGILTVCQTPTITFNFNITN